MTMDLQDAARQWHERNYPDAHDSWVLVKAAEELGELCRAVGGAREGRVGRGDPGDEACDLLLVVLSFVGRYIPDRNVIGDACARLYVAGFLDHPGSSGIRP